MVDARVALLKRPLEFLRHFILQSLVGWLVGGVFKGFAVFDLIFCFFGLNWFGFGNSPSGGWWWWVRHKL